MVGGLERLRHGAGAACASHIADLEGNHRLVRRWAVPEPPERRFRGQRAKRAWGSVKSIIEAVQASHIPAWRRCAVEGDAFPAIFVNDDPEHAFRKVALGREHRLDLGSIVDGIHDFGSSGHDTRANGSIRAGIHFTPEHIADMPIGADAELDTSKNCPFSLAIGRARSPW